MFFGCSAIEEHEKLHLPASDRCRNRAASFFPKCAVKPSVLSQALWCDMKWKPRRGLALDGHFVSGLMHGFTGCHFGYISESTVAASEAAGLILVRLLHSCRMWRKTGTRWNFQTCLQRLWHQISIYWLLNNRDAWCGIFSDDTNNW